MRRRALLSSLAVGGVLGIAGCIARVRPGASLGVDDDVDVEVWAEEVDRVVVTRGDSGSGMRIVASAEAVRLPKATVGFELENATVRSVEVNPFAWFLWRFEGDEWTPVYPERLPLPLATLAPGSSIEWDLIIDNTVESDERYAGPGKARKDGATLRGVLTGEHAVTIVGEFPNGRVRFVSRFDVLEPV